MDFNGDVRPITVVYVRALELISYVDQSDDTKLKVTHQFTNRVNTWCNYSLQRSLQPFCCCKRCSNGCCKTHQTRAVL